MNINDILQEKHRNINIFLLLKDKSSRPIFNIKVSILFFCLFIKHQRYIISLHSIHITYIKQELNKKYVKKREGIGKNYCYDQSHDK